MIKRKEILNNFNILLECESHEEVELWLDFLRNSLANKSDHEGGDLFFDGLLGHEASTLFWLERALKREAVKSCRYDSDSDKLIPGSWHWCKSGFKGSETSLPIARMGEKKTLFLDRDGVINLDSSYVFKRENFQFMDGIVKLLKWAQFNGFQVIVLTNQSGVGRGYYEEADVISLHKWVDQCLQEKGVKIDGWFYSPFHPKSKEERYKKESFSRKPFPGMALAAGEDFSIDFEKSLMIGDKKSDQLLDLDIPTYFIRGSYDLEGKSNIVNNHSELLGILEARFSLS